MIEIELVGTEIVGGRGPFQGRARFADVAVVVANNSRLYEIRRYGDAPAATASVVPIEAADWEYLLETDDGFEVKSVVAAFRHARLWIFRGWRPRGFFDELRALGARSVARVQDVDAWAVDAHRAYPARDREMRVLVDRACMAARADDADEAIAAAATAWELDPGFSVDQTILYAAVLQRFDRDSDAADQIHVQANTSGISIAEIEARVAARRASLIDTTPSRSGTGAGFFSRREPVANLGK